MEMKNRTGEVSINSKGEKMTIVDYIDSNNITIKFDDGTIVKNKKYSAFKQGIIKNPNFKNVYGFGVTGDEFANVRELKSYKTWCSMIERCYSKKHIMKRPTYENISVCEEWVYYRNFKEWYDKNYYEVEGERMCLDKDILIKNNKVYSPESCIYVPNTINLLFLKKKNDRNGVIGVVKKGNKYIARTNVGKSKKKHIGSYDNEIEAFNAYKRAKEEYIKQVADKYRNRIPKKLYDAMYRYEVEITD